MYQGGGIPGPEDKVEKLEHLVRGNKFKDTYEWNIQDLWDKRPNL